MNRTIRVSLLLFGSGLCALVYQTTWFREFRLVFGASTAASAAVLAIFMGGLGAGSFFLGKRADRHGNPLLFYAHLEFLVALSTALTPVLLFAIRQTYIWGGGTPRLGLFAGTVFRLTLAALVIGIPTFLMGGTLPAAARAVEAASDARRQRVAWLYGLNTLGAVTGALFSTFFLLETFGNRRTLWIACLLNALIALIARSMSRNAFGATEPPDVSENSTEESPAARFVSPKLVYAAAAIVGFVFLLMEIVWYRMLGPLLGGTSFTFGLILAVALLGIGLGGACYSLLGANRPATVSGFALTCALEALFVGIPFAIGDPVAMMAMLLRPLGTLGFGGFVLGWSTVAVLVILPPAFIAGIQFPLLIGLLGRGKEQVGRHIGQAYTWNTAGAVAGSLAGGFGLLPALSATGTWRTATIALAVLACAAAALALEKKTRFVPSAAIMAIALTSILLVSIATGPTAVWRHSPIGAGRADHFDLSVNDIKDWQRYQRRSVVWEEEGVESSVGISATDGLAFIVNGKIDGNSRGDAGTQVMAGLIGAAMHANPVDSMVIGLGTGSTAGWLGAVPSMRRVDVVELEPAILEVARQCAPVNLNVLKNPKTSVFIGDAREVLLATKRKYDVIFSEPSNPYRAGIANLYTLEFYQAVARRLKPGGLFLQWVQVYEIDRETVGTIYATLLKVFPHIDTFTTQGGDIVLVARRESAAIDVPILRKRLASEPYASAMQKIWRKSSVEGFLSHYVAGSSFARAASTNSEINTDDHTIVEFAFARHVGTSASVDTGEMWRLAAMRHEQRPAIKGGTVAWEIVERERYMADPEDYVETLSSSAVDVSRAKATNSLVLAQQAEVLADTANPEALTYLAELQKVSAPEADIILARLRWREGLFPQAVEALEFGYTRYRTDPWPLRPIMKRGLEVAIAIAAQNRPDLTLRLYQALAQPFSLRLLNEERLETLEVLSHKLEGEKCGPLSLQSVENFEPHTPWNRSVLERRRDCYRLHSHPRAGLAADELDEFLSAEPLPFAAGFPPSP